jgi:hypothetical protein
MKSTFTRVKISNPLGRLADAVEIVARVDSSFPHLRIPARLARKLGLNEVGSRSVPALGRGDVAGYAGPVELRVGNRSGYTGAVIQGDEVVLGAMAMTDMDLVVDPETGTVSPNPDNPNIASSVAKYALGFTGGSAERAEARPHPSPTWISIPSIRANGVASPSCVASAFR